MNLIFLTFAVILLASVVCGKYIHAYHFKYATEGSASLLLSAAFTGFISLCYYSHNRQPLPAGSLQLPDSVFFHILLPPIIFYAGFSIKKRMFFQNFATIFTFGFFGTLASAAALSTAASAALHAMGLAPQLQLQSALALGAVCACSDTVAILQIMDKRAYPVLYSIVFGEGIVNDAVAVVLLGAVNKLTARHTALSAGVLLELQLSFVNLFFSSLALGAAMGLLSALLVRFIFGKQHDADREVMLLGLLGYTSYLLADAADLSAILAVFFCGVTMSHYTWHSMCPAAQALALHTFRLAAGLMEMILYAYSGINMWTSALWQQPAHDSHMHLVHALILAAVLLLTTIIARVAFTYPVAAALSKLMACSPNSKQQLQQLQPQGRRISGLDATVIMWGGLSRGAITLALAYHHFSPEKEGVLPADHQVIILAVVIVVLVSTLALGTATGPFMAWLMTKHKQQQQQQQQCSNGHGTHWPDSTHFSTQEQHQVQQLSAPLLPQHHQQQQVLHIPPAGAETAAVAPETVAPVAGETALAVVASADKNTGGLVNSSVTSPPGGAMNSCCNADTDIQQQGPDWQLMSSAVPTASTAQLSATPFAPSATWDWGAHSIASRGRLPSMDELTQYIGDCRDASIASVAGSLVGSTAAIDAVNGSSTAKQQLPSEFVRQQQHLLAQQQALIRQQLQRLQLSKYGSFNGANAAAAELPFVHTPSDAEGPSIGASLALSREHSLAGSGAVSQRHSQPQLQDKLLHQSLQALAAQQGASGDATSMHSWVVTPCALGATGQELISGQPLAAAAAEAPESGKEQQWYLKQQLGLLQQLAQLQQEYHTWQLQHQQEPEQVLGGCRVGRLWQWSVHQVWRWFDVRYMQPVFGGREMARKTALPIMEFEHFGVVD